MIMLVSLEQASVHLRRDTEDDDADLEIKIAAASMAIISFLGDAADFIDSNGEVPHDTSGPQDVPELVQQATLLLISNFYRDRAGGSENFNAASLPDSVKALLYLAGAQPRLA